MRRMQDDTREIRLGNYARRCINEIASVAKYIGPARRTALRHLDNIVGRVHRIAGIRDCQWRCRWSQRRRRGRGSQWRGRCGGSQWRGRCRCSQWRRGRGGCCARDKQAKPKCRDRRSKTYLRRRLLSTGPFKHSTHVIRRSSDDSVGRPHLERQPECKSLRLLNMVRSIDIVDGLLGAAGLGRIFHCPGLHMPTFLQSNRIPKGWPLRKKEPGQAWPSASSYGPTPMQESLGR